MFVVQVLVFGYDGCVDMNMSSRPMDLCAVGKFICEQVKVYGDFCECHVVEA